MKKLSTASEETKSITPANSDTSTGLDTTTAEASKLSTRGDAVGHPRAERIKDLSVNAQRFSVDQVLAGVSTGDSMLKPGMTVLTNANGSMTGNEVVGVVKQIAPDFFVLEQVHSVRKGEVVYYDSMGMHSTWRAEIGGSGYVSILDGFHGKAWQNARVTVIDAPQRIEAVADSIIEKARSFPVITHLEVNGIEIPGNHSIESVERVVLDELAKQGVL